MAIWPPKVANKHTSVYCLLQSQKVATGYARNKIHKEAVKIDINASTDNTGGSRR